MKFITNSTEKITSLEIADVTGKNHRDIMRSIRNMEEAWIKLGQRNFAQSSYVNSQNREMPMYELSKTECLYIATKFNDVARAKLVLRWEQLEKERNKPMSPAETLLYNAQLLVQQEKRLSQIEQEVSEIKAEKQTRPDYFTIAGYGTLNGYKVNLKIASALGRRASGMCKKLGLPTDETPDPRFGRVKMYPKKVLDEVFEAYVF